MEEEVIKRVLPHSEETERAVIGCMLLEPDIITEAALEISGRDFYKRHYGIMFDAMAELNNDGVTVDAIILQNKIREKGIPEEFSSLAFLAEVIDSVKTSVDWKYYAGIVKEKSVLRNLIKVTEDIASQCYLSRDSYKNILENTEKQIFQILQNEGRKKEKNIVEIALNALRSIQKAAEKRSQVTGIPSGFYELDKRTAGFQPSNLILIAARPAMGKTAFVLNIAEYVALRKKIPVALFSLEMSAEELAKRIMSMDSRVKAQNLRTGELQDDEWNSLMESTIKLSESNLIIDDTGGLTIGELRSKCRRYKLEHGIQMIIIDYLQLMTGGRRIESRQQEISEISRSLKNLAMELEIPVIALSQLSRAVEQRPDKRPVLSDLRESGAIEQDADLVMFLYRDEYYNKDTEEPGVSEVIIGKQRSGPTATVKLAWLAEYTKFGNLEP